MTERFKAIEIPREQGKVWLTQWLTAGFDISTAVLASRPLDWNRFLTFIPIDASVEAVKFPDAPDVPGVVSDEGLAWFLEALMQVGAHSLIVEDDMVEKSDPKVLDEKIPSGFIGNRVVHWHELRPGSGQRAVEMIMNSASCILNAFVSTKPIEELCLVDAQELPEGIGEKVAASLLAIVTFAFDETSFAVWDGR